MGKKNDEEIEVPVVTIETDDGAMECAIISIFETEKYIYQYAALIESDKIESEDGEIFIYRYKDLGNDDIELSQIDSEEEFDFVCETFDALLDSEEFNDED